MTKKLKYLIGLNIVILLSFQLTYSEILIYPKKKPILSSETLEKKILENVLIPPKKTFQIEKNNILGDFLREIIKKNTLSGHDIR